MLSYLHNLTYNPKIITYFLKAEKHIPTGFILHPQSYFAIYVHFVSVLIICFFFFACVFLCHGDIAYIIFTPNTKFSAPMILGSLQASKFDLCSEMEELIKKDILYWIISSGRKTDNSFHLENISP